MLQCKVSFTCNRPGHCIFAVFLLLVFMLVLLFLCCYRFSVNKRLIFYLYSVKFIVSGVRVSGWNCGYG